MSFWFNKSDSKTEEHKVVTHVPGVGGDIITPTPSKTDVHHTPKEGYDNIALFPDAPAENVREPAHVASLVKFSDFSKESRNFLTAEHIDGARIEITRHFSSRAWCTHTFALGGREEPAGYSFAGMTVSEKYGTVFRAETDAAQGVRNIVMVTDTKHWFSRVNVQVAKPTIQALGAALEGEYRGNKFIAGGSLMPPGRFSLNFSRVVNKTLTVGGEMMAALDRGLVMFFGGLRYSGPDHVWTGIMNNMGTVKLTYAQQIEQKAGLAAELELDTNSGESVARVGYEVVLRASNIKASIDTTGRVQSQLKQALASSVLFSISADLDHAKNDYRFGLGLQIQM